MRFASIACIFVFSVAPGLVRTTAAQSSDLNSNYTVQLVNDTFAVLNGATLLSADQFLDGAGAIDHDNGVAVSIPVGFTFDYNGNTYSSVNVSVNGWVSFGESARRLAASDPLALFTSDKPDNLVAPYWGDHFYRILEQGYTASRIEYLTATDHEGVLSPSLHSFYLEWRNLNVNDKQNPNAVATFELRIIQNPLAWNDTTPDQRAKFEFRYGGASDPATLRGSSVGAKDLIGQSRLNTLFETSQFGGDSTRLSERLTSCWPPTNCTSGKAILIAPLPHQAAVVNRASSYKNSMSLYPQPMHNQLSIELPAGASEAGIVRIYNSLGIEVYEDNVDAGRSIELSNMCLRPGVYQVRIDTREGSYANKLIVE